MFYQGVAACCYPFIQNSFTKLAAIWFGEKERTTAATTGALAFSVGCIIGFFMGPLVVHDTDREEENWERGREHVSTLTLYIAILTTVLSLPTLILYR